MNEPRYVFRGTGEKFDPREYLVCQRRGHESNGAGLTEGLGPTWMYCKYCGCKFRMTEPEMVEHPDDTVMLQREAAGVRDV